MYYILIIEEFKVFIDFNRNFSISWGRLLFATFHWIPAFAGMMFGCNCPSFPRRQESRHLTLSY